MTTSLIILGISVVLFVYWFRYSCLLVLRTPWEPERVRRAVAANSLRVADLSGEAGEKLPFSLLDRALDSDYRLLTFLLSHCGDLPLSHLAQALLSIDFHMLRVWYRLARVIWPSAGQRALAEMLSILRYMAGALGERTVTIDQ